MDEGAHWSITDIMYALQKPVYLFAHGDPEDLERKIKANLKPGEKPLIASDGIFPTFGKVAPIPDYFKIAERYDGCIWLDDCHAIGVLGENGRGTYEYYGLKSPRLFFGGTLSKAVGAHGGIIPGTAELVLPIRAGHIVNGANASLSAAAGAAIKGMELVDVPSRIAAAAMAQRSPVEGWAEEDGLRPGRFSCSGGRLGAEERGRAWTACTSN